MTTHTEANPRLIRIKLALALLALAAGATAVVIVALFTLDTLG